MSAPAATLAPTSLPLGPTLGRVAESMAETAGLMDVYEGHVSALIQKLTDLPDCIEDLQHLDRISQTLRGLATIIARAGDAIPAETLVHRDMLFAGIGLGALTERVEGADRVASDTPDSGECDLF